MKRLIINADDFGLTESVNRGILECHRRGVISSTTLLVNGEAAAEAAGQARSSAALGVGLHLNFTSGKPVLPPERIPSLVDRQGMLPGVGKMTRRLISGRARRAELADETRAQLDKCHDIGIEPTHVDSHHHMLALPRLRSVVQQVCAEAGIKKMRGYHMSARSLKSLFVRLPAQIPAGAAMLTPERFFGIDNMGKRDMAAALRRELAIPGDTLEFMCHPGFADERLSEVSSYNSPRQTELEALLSDEFTAVLRETGVELISFRDL